MVLYLEQIEVPSARADAFASWQVGQVAKAVAAMGRGSVARRGRLVRDGDACFHSVYELGDLNALESFFTSREQDDLTGELREKFPDAKVERTFAELVGGPRRGMRFGEEPRAALVLEVTVAAGQADGWIAWNDGEHVPDALRDKGLVRTRLFELHNDTEQQRRFLELFDAVDLESIEGYRRESTAKVTQEHEQRFPGANLVREVWEWLP